MSLNEVKKRGKLGKKMKGFKIGEGARVFFVFLFFFETGYALEYRKKLARVG